MTKHTTKVLKPGLMKSKTEIVFKSRNAGRWDSCIRKLAQVSSGSVKKEAVYKTKVQGRKTGATVNLAETIEESRYIKHQTPGDQDTAFEWKWCHLGLPWLEISHSLPSRSQQQTNSCQRLVMAGDCKLKSVLIYPLESYWICSGSALSVEQKPRVIAHLPCSTVTEYFKPLVETHWSEKKGFISKYHRSSTMHLVTQELWWRCTMRLMSLSCLQAQYPLCTPWIKA